MTKRIALIAALTALAVPASAHAGFSGVVRVDRPGALARLLRRDLLGQGRRGDVEGRELLSQAREQVDIVLVQRRAVGRVDHQRPDGAVRPSRVVHNRRRAA